MGNSILMAFLNGASQAVPDPIRSKPLKKIDQKTMEAAKLAFQKAHKTNADSSKSGEDRTILCSGFAPNLEVDFFPDEVFKEKMGCTYEEFINGNGYFDDNGDYHHIPGDQNENGSWNA
jgi:hypothetical protein